MISKTIKRKIQKEDRFFEILDSMRNPHISVTRSDVGVPSATVSAIAENGICEYLYNHSGTIGLDSFLERLASKMQPTDHRVEEETKSKMITYIVELSNKLDNSDLQDIIYHIKSKYRLKLQEITL